MSEYDPKRLDLVFAPDKRLLTVCDPIDRNHVSSDDIRAAANEMISIMRQKNGLGLAACQAGLLRRMFVMHIPRRMAKLGSPYSRSPIVLVNPEIVSETKQTEIDYEGCLSQPGVRKSVRRSVEVVVEYETPESSERIQMKATGLTARCIQHEIDHLNGIILEPDPPPIDRKPKVTAGQLMGILSAMI